HSRLVSCLRMRLTPSGRWEAQLTTLRNGSYPQTKVSVLIYDNMSYEFLVVLIEGRGGDYPSPRRLRGKPSATDILS
ncbi:hypothetical protein ACH5RR_028929, partial [Cinchona calisaya]